MRPAQHGHAKQALKHALPALLCAACSPATPAEVAAHASGPDVSSSATALGTATAAPTRTESAPRATLTPWPRSAEPRVAALRDALDFGRLDAVRAQLADAALAPAEASELRARAAALAGRTLEALRQLETWRATHPADPTSYAAAAEIYGNAQKFDAAWEELGRGERACGPSAEFARAKGVLWILREGGAEKGLALLESAQAADPALAFAGRALAQAHLLVAKLELRAVQQEHTSKGDASDAAKFASACAHAAAALRHDPADVDVQRLDADLAAARGDFGHAISVVGALVARGEPLQAELASLYKKAGFGALLERRRDVALERFRAARELGLGAEELGSGAALLEQEAHARADEGLDAFARGDIAEAELCCEAALRWDPDELAARNQLGVIHFRAGRYADAAREWRRVLASAERDALTLPEPVHVNLAKALALAGDPGAAIALLAAELAADPDGRWSEATRALQAALESARTR